MRRRDFIKMLGGAAAWPLASQAQPVANVPVITLINARKADAAAALAAEFRKGLSQSGFTEGKDVVVEYHWLDGNYDDVAAILDDAVIEAGCDDYDTKPVELDRLIGKIGRLLGTAKDEALRQAV